MKKFIILRSLILALILLSIIFMPIISFIAIFALLIMFIISGISTIINSGKASSAGEFLFAIIIGICMIFQGFDIFESLGNSEISEILNIIIFCGALIYAGASPLQKLVYNEEDEFYMDKKVHKLTCFYPKLIIVSAVIRLLITVTLDFFGQYVADYTLYLYIGIWIGVLIFGIAIAQYIVRMLHIYKRNK